MKHCLAILVCLITLPILAGSNDIDALAREFFRLNTPEESLRSDILDQIDMLTPYLSSMLKEEGLSEDSGFSFGAIKELFGFIMEELDYDAMVDIGAEIIRSQYSYDDLIALIAFLSSPAGQAYAYNSRPASNYLPQAMKTYFEEKAKDEKWLMGLVMSLLSNLGLSDGLIPAPAPTDEDWAIPVEVDSTAYYPWDDYWDAAAPVDSSYWYEDNPAPVDTVAVSYDNWDDYWGGSVPVTITMNGRFIERVDEIAYLFGEVLPALARIYKWLDEYTQEYGGYPSELNWSEIDPVKGYDLDYDHDAALLKANSNSSHTLPGVELIYYINENNVWITVPCQP